MARCAGRSMPHRASTAGAAPPAAPRCRSPLSRLGAACRACCALADAAARRAAGRRGWSRCCAGAGGAAAATTPPTRPRRRAPGYVADDPQRAAQAAAPSSGNGTSTATGSATSTRAWSSWATTRRHDRPHAGRLEPADPPRRRGRQPRGLPAPRARRGRARTSTPTASAPRDGQLALVPGARPHRRTPRRRPAAAHGRHADRHHRAAGARRGRARRRRRGWSASRMHVPGILYQFELDAQLRAALPLRQRARAHAARAGPAARGHQRQRADGPHRPGRPRGVTASIIESAHTPVAVAVGVPRAGRAAAACAGSAPPRRRRGWPKAAPSGTATCRT